MMGRRWRKIGGGGGDRWKGKRMMVRRMEEEMHDGG